MKVAVQSSSGAAGGILCPVVLVVMLLLGSTMAHAELDEPTRQAAVQTAFGLGCAVQDRDIVRANAWLQLMMGRITALAERNTQTAFDFSAQINGVMERGASTGGFNCELVLGNRTGC
jgi:hypothetical protein